MPPSTPPQEPATISQEAREIPPLLAELSAQQFQEWRRHPVSQLLLERYLPDLRRGLEREAWNAFLSNRLSLVAEQELRGRLLTMVELEQLPLAVVRVFYGLDPQGKAK